MFLRLGIKALRNDVVVVPRLKLARPRATVVFCLWMVESPMEVVVTPLKMEELPKETVVFPLAMEVLPTARAVLPSVMLVLPMEPVAGRQLLRCELHGCQRARRGGSMGGQKPNQSGHSKWPK